MDSLMLKLIFSLAIAHGVTNAFFLDQDDSVMHPSVMFPQTGQQNKRRVEDVDHWRTSAIEDLTSKLNNERVIKKAKNVIMFLGDGMDVSTITAARILKGQQVDKVAFGEEAKLHLESFPDTGYSKTYCANSQVADSACSATAYLGGVKTNIGTIGVTSNVIRGFCNGQQNETNHVNSIITWAQAAGKSTGVVTTTRVTHASPAGTYAHVSDRFWESDRDVRIALQNPDTCDDIAEQLILRNPGKNIDVILGGGRSKFRTNTDLDPEDGTRGERMDGVNLINMWRTMKTENGTNNVTASYVQTLDDLKNVNASKTEALLGLFSSGHLAYYHDQEVNDDPSLADMTEKAIEILSKNPNGFFLFVEGGRIDQAHHDNLGLRALWETIEFDRAIQKGDEMTSDQDTLIVVTADHGHTLSISGYAERGHKIGGIAGIGIPDLLAYSTLNYANGPGFKPFTGERRHNIREDDLDDLDTQQVPLVPLTSETHGGMDVAILAKGPFSHLFNGVHEQSYIPYAMGYASCVGSGPTLCDSK